MGQKKRLRPYRKDWLGDPHMLGTELDPKRPSSTPWSPHAPTPFPTDEARREGRRTLFKDFAQGAAAAHVPLRASGCRGGHSLRL